MQGVSKGGGDNGKGTRPIYGGGRDWENFWGPKIVVWEHREEKSRKEECAEQSGRIQRTRKTEEATLRKEWKGAEPEE